MPNHSMLKKHLLELEKQLLEPNTRTTPTEHEQW
jgi:hypothetical protein